MLSLSSRAILKRSFPAHLPAARSNIAYSLSLHDTRDQEATPRRGKSTVRDSDSKVLEAKKQKNLANEQHTTSIPIPEAPGWSEDVSTTSEAHVKADKSGDTTATLVSKTVEHIHARHSPEERLGSREAPYERDAVEGPLSSGTPESPGSQVRKIHLYEEMLEHATPSEEAVKSDRGEV